ncbi:MAG TPA: EamA family transporter [Caulobacterales bacterium]|nr:EamA family transporter [Caulobacterales bacterium]
MTAVSVEAKAASAADLIAIAICTLAWGTTWFAITLQLGAVDAVVSVVYRFGIASALLFLWCILRGERIGMTPAQHLATLGTGVFTFGINYAMVYWAEERVNSAVVAVIFALMAFINLALFRVLFRQRAPLLAWAGACLGVAGVASLSWGEISAANLSSVAILGMVLALGSVFTASLGNAFARRSEIAGTSLIPATAWGMAYGAGGLALLAFATGRHWAFQPTWSYTLSLLYLAVIGSVVAFLFYFSLARRSGYALASYTSALTPPLAMAVSSLFEAKHWGASALAGVALVVSGQWLLLRSKRV